ncbi:ABC transporter substrate-binding protein [Candidatus Nomurabacteria bacterium]|nr:ABC transporter substrate-binding protein [Candidatus Nomurabacteria bacterium]
MKHKIIWIIAILVLVFLAVSAGKNDTENVDGETVKIGVITPLTGDLAYWGESSVFGIALAKKDLAVEGINTEFIIEDGQLEPTKALNAAQKLVNSDNVVAIYSEFNPAAIAVTSFLKDKNVFHLYDAAPVSPLENTRSVYKTYLDYFESCKKVAQIANKRGWDKLGVLKINLEFGDLCLQGIKSVYGDNLIVQEYNPGTRDFRSMILKLKDQNVKAVSNVSFVAESFSSLKQMEQQGLKVPFVGLAEIISPDSSTEYGLMLENSILFGLPEVEENFSVRLKQEFPGKTVGNIQASALAFIHAKQLAYAFTKCGRHLDCVDKQFDRFGPESLIGFQGFTNRVAGFDVWIGTLKNGALVKLGN